MAECERCGDDVRRRFTHRIRTETMTHRRTKRVCAGCHPSIPQRAVAERTADRSRASETVVTDGGAPIGACPLCSGTTVPDGDAVSCVDCGWTGSR